MTTRPRGQDVYALPIRRRSAALALRELKTPTGPSIAGAHVMSALLRVGLQVLGSSKTAHNVDRSAERLAQLAAPTLPRAATRRERPGLEAGVA